MTTVYDILPGTGEFQNYTSNALDTQLYPDSNNVSVFGPLWLPRVYGKDLTSFEIASSGKIAITINDVHALDIANFDGKTQLAAKADDSFEIAVSSNSMVMTFDATSNDITILSAKGDTNIVASNDVSFTSSNDVNVTALNDYMLVATNDATLKASTGSLLMTADSETMKIDMNATSNTIYIAATDGSVEVDALAEFKVNAEQIALEAVGDMSLLTGSQGTFEILANNGHASLTMDGALGTTTFNGIGNFTVGTLADVYLYGADGSVSLNLKENDLSAELYARSNVKLSACNDVTVSAKQDVGITASNGTLDLSANQSRTSILMGLSNDIQIYGSNNVVVSASNTYTVQAHSNISLLADNGDLALYAESNVYLSADTSNMTFTMDRDGDVISIYSLSNITATACNAIAIDSASNVSITASSNIEMFSRSNVVVNTSNSLLMTACNDIKVSSTSNIMFATYDTTINSSNDLNVTSCNDVTITAKNDLTLAASNMSFSLSGDLAYRAASNISFYINQSADSNNPTFMISPDRVNIVGDLYIEGSINTSNIVNTTVVQQSLKINDKTVLLASEGDEGGAPIDGTTTNSGAGIIVDGLPASESNVELWRKSIQWNYGSAGMPVLGTSNITTEPAWEVLGGGMRITHKRMVGNDIKDLSFTFRVNELDELELVKKYWNTTASAYTWKRVAKFGRIVGSGVF